MPNGAEFVKILASDPAMHLPARLLADLFQSDQKEAPVVVVEENVLLMVTTIHDVVNRPGILNAELAGHTNTDS